MLPQDQNNLTPELFQELATMKEWHEAGAIIIPLQGRYLADYSVLPPEEYDKGKIPLGSWKGNREKLYQTAVARFKANKHLIGLIPGSLGFVCIDVDDGNPNDIVDLLAQFDIDCTTVQTTNGAHIFARDAGWPSGNFKWEYASASGDIRFDKGYIVVWNILATKQHLIKSDSILGVDDRIAKMLKGAKQKGMFKPPAACHSFIVASS